MPEYRVLVKSRLEKTRDRTIVLSFVRSPCCCYDVRALPSRKIEFPEFQVIFEPFELVCRCACARVRARPRVYVGLFRTVGQGSIYRGFQRGGDPGVKRRTYLKREKSSNIHVISVEGQDDRSVL